MNHLLNNLIVYNHLKEDPVLSAFAGICRRVESDGLDEMPSPAESEELRTLAFDSIHRIMEVATQYGFEENLWATYVTYQLMMDENPFALVHEKQSLQKGSASEFALRDCRFLMDLLHYDFSRLEEALSTDCFSVLTKYRTIRKHERMYFGNISHVVNDLTRKLSEADTPEAFLDALSVFYQEYGVGMFGLNKAFRIRENADGTPELIPISNLENVNYDDLVGYELQKEQVSANTLAFLEGKASNNTLLYGDAGTGKSTTVKATLNEFFPKGLRLIEIYKHQFKDLSYVISRIKTRNYKFIIYMDDLSFEDFEIEYKYLKAVIEGGFETRPDNILIYATSNRRHLIRETVSDRNDMGRDQDVHHSDTLEEKLSLVDRFGLNVLYTRPSFDEYHEIVRRLAKKHGITMTEEDLIAKANAWSVKKGGHTGRIAQQFINSLNPKL